MLHVDEYTNMLMSPYEKTFLRITSTDAQLSPSMEVQASVLGMQMVFTLFRFA